MPIGLDRDDKRLAGRQYTQTNREIWKQLNFSMMTTSVHEEDRSLVLAELEVLKFQRLAMMAEDEDTDIKTLKLIALRNVRAAIKQTELDEIEKGMKHSKAETEIRHCLKQAQHYNRKKNGILNNLKSEELFAERTRQEAKAVSYANLTAAFYRVAQELVEYSGRSSIFGLREQQELL